ncbi:MAG: PadR family transcriptional regulator, partial [Promethearchaeota archaeon]
YEMIKELNKLFAGTWEAKSGTIYPILSKLESKKRMILGTHKKSPLGPVKKIYILEDKGRESIDSIIHSNFEGNLDFLTHYVNLIAPFLLNYPEDENKLESERLLEKIMDIPGKMVNLTKQESITQTDRKLKIKKLEKLKTRLQSIIQEIDSELKR